MNIDCMACIANHVAGAPSNHAITIDGITHAWNTGPGWGGGFLVCEMRWSTGLGYWSHAEARFVPEPL